MIPIGNIYYMLAYCFRVLKNDSFQKLSSEDFEDATELCAAILAKGVERQLKQGLGRQYVPRSEELTTLRGKIDISESIKTRSVLKMQLVCAYDEFSVDSPMNRILKTTMLSLLTSDISKDRKKALRRLLPYFDEVGIVDLHRINWNFRYDRNNQTYRLLMFVCRLVIDGLLQREDADGANLPAYLEDQALHQLYENFVRAYYQQEHKELSASRTQVPWALDDDSGEGLPVMQTDTTLQCGDDILIIDTKFYGTTMQRQHGSAPTVHSNNLYQVYAYVKNMQAARATDKSPVAGMLLYAKTDEQLVPDFRYSIDGNQIEVRTLDLSGDFASIRSQLDSIAEQYFEVTQGALV